jgi:phage-related holin
MKHFFTNVASLLIAYVIVIITPIIPILIGLGVFIFCAWVTGMIKAYKTKQPITSRKMSQTATKTLLYFMLIICSQILDTHFKINVLLPIPVTQIASGFLALIEFKSVTENISEILGIPIWDFIKSKIYRKDV